MTENNLENNSFRSSGSSERDLGDYSSNSNQKTMSSDDNPKNSSNTSDVTNPSKWSEIISKLVEKLMGKDLKVTYSFDNLEIEIPKAEGPGGKNMGSVKWRINGSLSISAELLKASSNSP